MLIPLLLTALAVALVVVAAIYRRDEIETVRARVWDFLVRFRTWLLGTAGAVLMVLPDLMAALPDYLRAPELTAVLSDDARKWVGLVALILLVWSRWRPASRAADPEVQVKRTLKATDTAAAVIVKTPDGEPLHVQTVVPGRVRGR